MAQSAYSTLYMKEVLHTGRPTFSFMMWRTNEYIEAKTNYNHEALRSAYHTKVTKKFNTDVARFSGQVGKKRAAKSNKAA